jgi:hypothetical protein
MEKRTKKIPGLPQFPATMLREVKEPPRKGQATRTARGLTFEFHNGLLRMVLNPKGHRPAVGIVQTGHPGYTVRLDNSPYTVLGYGYRKIAKLSVRLALRGHRKVTLYT